MKTRIAILVVAACVCVITVIVLRSLNETRQYEALAQCAYNLHEIGIACRAYADKHGGVLPRSFSQITNDIQSADVFVSPLSGNKPGKLGDVDAWCDYALVPGLTEVDTNRAFAYYFRSSGPNKRGTILLANGTVFMDCGNAQYVRYVRFVKEPPEPRVNHR